MEIELINMDFLDGGASLQYGRVILCHISYAFRQTTIKRSTVDVSFWKGINLHNYNRKNLVVRSAKNKNS